MAITRRELFTQIVNEWVERVIEKDTKYGGDVIAGAIRDQQFIDPKQSILARVNEKWNRIKSNPFDEEIIAEETFDIWGYFVVREAIKRLEAMEGKVPEKIPGLENNTVKNETKKFEIDASNIKEVGDPLLPVYGQKDEEVDDGKFRIQVPGGFKGELKPHNKTLEEIEEEAQAYVESHNAEP